MSSRQSELNMIGWPLARRALLALLVVSGIALLACGGAGCASVPSPSSPVWGPFDQVELPGSVSSVAVLAVGCRYVDSSAYAGDSMSCPGADVDARAIAAAGASHGVRGTLLLNSAATWANVKQSVAVAAATLPSWGRLVIAFSGHGGYVADDNGDEPTGRDSTLCLWDGEVRDDRVLAELLEPLPQGIEVVILSDCCHAEGNFRSAARILQRTVSLGRWGRMRATPLIGRAIARRQRVDAWAGPLIQLAGCRADSYSLGSATGGTFTQALLAAMPGRPGLQAWYRQAEERMPSTQVPAWVEYGAVEDTFRMAFVFDPPISSSVHSPEAPAPAESPAVLPPSTAGPAVETPVVLPETQVSAGVTFTNPRPTSPQPDGRNNGFNWKPYSDGKKHEYSLKWPSFLALDYGLRDSDRCVILTAKRGICELDYYQLDKAEDGQSFRHCWTNPDGWSKRDLSKGDLCVVFRAGSALAMFRTPNDGSGGDRDANYDASDSEHRRRRSRVNDDLPSMVVLTATEASTLGITEN